jgi:hypothetical protein
LRFETATVLGNIFGYNALAARPAAVLDLGAFKLKAAAEYRRQTDQEVNKPRKLTSRGAGAGFLVILDPVEFGGNAAYGVVDAIDPFGIVDERGSVDTLSLGGFASTRVVGSLVLGAGANLTLQGDRQVNDQTARHGHFEHQQLFAAIQHRIFIDQLTAKLVLAYAKADLEPAFENPRVNEMYSARLRLLFVF